MILWYKIEQVGGSVGFLLVPAHLGWNEVADEAAKNALKKDIDVSVYENVMVQLSGRKTTAMWQKKWEIS